MVKLKYKEKEEERGSETGLKSEETKVGEERRKAITTYANPWSVLLKGRVWSKLYY